MFLLKILFEDEDQIVGLCAFKKYFAHQVYREVDNFNATKLVYSAQKRPKLNVFANS